MIQGLWLLYKAAVTHFHTSNFFLQIWLCHLMSLSRHPTPLLVLKLGITQYPTRQSLYILFIQQEEIAVFTTDNPPYEWKSGKREEIAERQRQSEDCVVWLETACWSSLPWCFENRWRKCWLKPTAGNYFARQPLLIFSELIYKFSCVLVHHWKCFFLDGQSTVMFKVLCVWSLKRGT